MNETLNEAVAVLGRLQFETGGPLLDHIVALQHELVAEQARRVDELRNAGLSDAQIGRSSTGTSSSPTHRLGAATVVLVALLCGAGAPSRAQDQRLDDEQQVGQQVFNELKAKGEIVASSPLYDQLKPIAAAITRTAQPRYNHPFKFYLVHEQQPNAFATAGGNVYVTDSLMYFVKNTEQLAGTLCHEVSHTIHHDTMTLIEKERKIERREIGAAVLLGPSRAHLLAIALLGKLRSLGYSRDVESAADLTGADVCAASAYNPWGLVWLFQDFDAADAAQIPQLLSDHPDNQHRVDALKQHFRQNPSVFGSFSADARTATTFVVPKDAAEVFLR